MKLVSSGLGRILLVNPNGGFLFVKYAGHGTRKSVVAPLSNVIC
jgi:hypothetical protein